MGYSIRTTKTKTGTFFANVNTGAYGSGYSVHRTEEFTTAADAYQAANKWKAEKAAANKAKKTGSNLSDAIKAIVAKLNVHLADLDAEMLRRQKAWVAGRVEAVAAWKATDEAKTMRRNDNSKYYQQLHHVAGGKTWYAVVSMTEAKRNTFIEKNCEAIRDARNALIGRKLAENNVASLADETVEANYSDGFEGSFTAKTDAGETKTVTINVIGAGGYNIQCYHQRTLVHVR
jgi:hypothetical protein